MSIQIGTPIDIEADAVEYRRHRLRQERYIELLERYILSIDYDKRGQSDINDCRDRSILQAEAMLEKEENDK